MNNSDDGIGKYYSSFTKVRAKSGVKNNGFELQADENEQWVVAVSCKNPLPGKQGEGCFSLNVF